MTATVAASPSLAQRYQQAFPNSARRYQQARTLFPNGVTHDMRYLEPFPVYIERAAGSRKWDLDGHELIDYWSGHGALLLGHSPPAVVEAVRTQMGRATHPGACHELEIEWGQWVQRLMPAAERMRFVGSGTEATLMALRLARMFTGKPKLLKFAGHFHGWHDFVIPGADAPFDAELPGIPAAVAKHTVIVPPNDIAAVERALAADPEIGSVILEPTGGHYGVVPLRGPFLRELRDLTRRRNVVLIFDEVVTGFRVHPGGAQGLYDIQPDLITLAKILAGGLPGGCLAGRADILALLEFRPGKPKMKHPGTFNANPLSAAAGVATLKVVAEGEANRKANEAGRRLRQGLNQLFAERDLDWVAYGEFSRVNLLPGYRGPRPTSDDFIPYDNDYRKLDGPSPGKLAQHFRCAMLLHGLDFMGMKAITNAAHTPEDTERTVAAFAGGLDLLQAEGVL
jgi:glutamate-1-semialdehyde 2,1-aminomutase